MKSTQLARRAEMSCVFIELYKGKDFQQSVSMFSKDFFIKLSFSLWQIGDGYLFGDTECVGEM